MEKMFTVTLLRVGKGATKHHTSLDDPIKDFIGILKGVILQSGVP